jgi:hypothetical protein
MTTSLVPKAFRPIAVVRAYDDLRAVLDGQASPSSLPDHAREESRLQAFLATFAAMEGVMREDMDRRVAVSAEDLLTVRLRFLAARARARNSDVRIEDILDAWRLQFTAYAHEIGKLKQYIEYRNWLAHGRCIPMPRSGLAMDPHRFMAIFRRIRSLIAIWPDE